MVIMHFIKDTLGQVLFLLQEDKFQLWILKVCGPMTILQSNIIE